MVPIRSYHGSVETGDLMILNDSNNDVFQPRTSRDAGFLPVDMCMLWPWLYAEPELIAMAATGLEWMYGRANKRWNEAQTKTSIIYPVLTRLLGFPALELTESPDRIACYQGTQLHPDYYLPHACVIEAKKIGVSLLSYSAEASNFRSTLDQGMSYLDAYDARSCIVTNGWDWYAIWRTLDRDPWLLPNAAYYAARFRLDEVVETNDLVRLEQFLSMFNAYSLSGQCNRAEPISGFFAHPVKRRLYDTTSTLYFADVSNRPLRGQGSGFQFQS